MEKKTHYTLVSLFLMFAMYFLAGEDQLEGDTLWHVRVGEWILENHTVPKIGIFSWTGEYPWHAHEWLWEVIAYGFHQAFGFNGLFFLTGIGFFMFFGILFYLIRNSHWYGFFLMFPLMFISAFYFIARPHSLAFGLFALWMLLMSHFFTRWKMVWVSVVSFAISVFWVNIHASVILAPFIATLFFLFIRDRRYLMSALFSFLGTLLNPWFIGVYPYAFMASRQKEIIDQISEWSSPDFHNTFLLVIFALFFSLGLWGVYRLISKKEYYPHIVLFFIFLFMFLSSVRYFLYFLFMDIWIFSIAIKDKKVKTPKLIPYVALLLSILFFIGSIKALPPSDISRSKKEPFPVQAMAYLKENELTNHVISEYWWGGYLIYEGIPAFIDGRADMYVLSKSGVLKDFLRFMTAHDKDGFFDPMEIVKKYDIKTAILKPNSIPAHFLEQNGWVMVYGDDKGEVWTIEKKGEKSE